MGSIDSFDTLIINSNSQDRESSNSGCSGLELMSSNSSGMVDLNIQNMEPEEEKPSTPKKSVRTSSKVDVSEECPRDRDITNNDTEVKRSTPALSGNQEDSPVNCEKKKAWVKKSKKDDNDARVERSNRALSGTQPASPRNCENKCASGEKGKKDKESPRFKRRVSCTQPVDPPKKRIQLSIPKNIKNGQSIVKRQVSSTQPMSANNLINWNMESKKQAAIATKMRRKAERAEQKLELVRSKLKIVYDILMN